MTINCCSSDKCTCDNEITCLKCNNSICICNDSHSQICMCKNCNNFKFNLIDILNLELYKL